MTLILEMKYAPDALAGVIEDDAWETVGWATIQNNGTGTPEAGNYDVTFFNGKRKWKATTVEGVDRKKRIGWDILCVALHKLLANRNFLSN